MRRTLQSWTAWIRMHSVMLGYGFSCVFLTLGISVQRALPAHAAGVSSSSVSGTPQACEEYLGKQLREERALYRRVQYGDAAFSVLGDTSLQTSDLVPYLTLNYHALSCRLRALCDAVGFSQGHLGTGTVLPQRPIGCSRLFAARGRWWSDERRDQDFQTSPIPECSFLVYEQVVAGLIPSQLLLKGTCEVAINQILSEERQMLYVLATEDSTQRGTRTIVGVLQAVMSQVRDTFLEPLRSIVDLFGTVLHPIPCLLTQCN